MRSPRGLTLVELMVVLAILVILAGFALPGLREWKQKYDIETAMRQLYVALNEARMRAFNDKRTCGLVWEKKPVSVIKLCCDSDGDGEIEDEEELWRKDLKVALETNIVNAYCTFSHKGFSNTVGRFYYVVETNADYDCIIISKTRIKMGKQNGDHCIPR